ncbi:MAG TPA: hypothetical protein VFS29_03315 [Motilibacteraceae bacterium]|nr:hypothetical protein [Motilibacteraceae bacterium]
MIDADTARALRDSGLAWRPAPGDWFVIDREDLREEPFVLSHLVVDVQDVPGGQVLGFNGTVEWALDSVALEEALWLPREDQLRELLRDDVVRLERATHGWRLVVLLGGRPTVVTGDDPVACYAQAVLARLTCAAPRTPDDGERLA